MISCPGLLPSCFLAAAAALPSEISLTDALLLLVFAGLIAATWQLTKLLRRLDTLEERLVAPPAPRPVAVVSAAAAPAPQPVPAALAPEFPAVIAAAVYAALGQPVRILSITEVAGGQQVWSLEGRRQIFASHQVR